MAFEIPTCGGTLRLLRIGCKWAVESNGHRRTRWTSVDDATMAVVRHATGLTEWDRTQSVVPDDLLRWRPIGENL
jgi:hypothetical protein